MIPTQNLGNYVKIHGKCEWCYPVTPTSLKYISFQFKIYYIVPWTKIISEKGNIYLQEAQVLGKK